MSCTLKQGQDDGHAGHPGRTNRSKDTVQSQVGPDKTRADTDQSTIKTGDTSAGTLNSGPTVKSSGIPAPSQRNSEEAEGASNSPAGTSPPSTINRPPVIFNPTEESNVRLREPLLED